MDTCTLCGSTITENYFRVRSNLSCAACARAIADEVNRDPTPFIVRGVVYAFAGAVIGGLLRAAFEGLMSLGDGLSFAGMFSRWFVFVAVAALIVGAAKAGARGRSAPALQISCVAFYYLAVSLAFVPVVFSLNAKLPLNFASVGVISLLYLELPFSSIPRNPMNATGLIAIFFCMATVWAGTAAAPSPVDGPFEMTAPEIEPNFFKRRAMTPVGESSSSGVSQ